MADATHIEWTDATWNPITGCSVVSPGCTNCYAMKLAGTRLKHIPSRKGLTIETKAGPVWNGEVRFNAEWLDKPLRWKRPRKIFVNAHGDLFHERVPDAWIDKIFAVMALAHRHTYQVLTKRSARLRRYMTAPDLLDRICAAMAAIAETLPKGKGTSIRLGDIAAHDAWAIARNLKEGHAKWPLPNIWLGVSAEDQPRWDERVADLLFTPAAKRFVSVEPMVGPIAVEVIDLDGYSEIYPLTGTDGCEDEDGEPGDDVAGLDWVILGGESGPGARPMHPDWARAVRDACAEQGVAFFFKQWGEYAPAEALSPGFTATGFSQWLPGSPQGAEAIVYRVGKKAAGRLLDGVLHDAMPGAAHG